MGFRYEKLPKHLQKAIDKAVDDQDARDREREQKRSKGVALERPSQNPQSMVNIPGPLLVRIIRHYGKGEREYDDDNQSGGCKELRDSIAAAHGRRGDSAQDGFAWEYAQRPSETGEPMTEIEIYEGTRG